VKGQGDHAGTSVPRFCFPHPPECGSSWPAGTGTSETCRGPQGLFRTCERPQSRYAVRARHESIRRLAHDSTTCRNGPAFPSTRLGAKITGSVKWLTHRVRKQRYFCQCGYDMNNTLSGLANLVGKPSGQGGVCSWRNTLSRSAYRLTICGDYGCGHLLRGAIGVKRYHHDDFCQTDIAGS
jgi:hypothetical protein